MLYAGSFGVQMPRVLEKEALDKGEATLRIRLFSLCISAGEWYGWATPDHSVRVRWTNSSLA
jgi:hypothetical protein